MYLLDTNVISEIRNERTANPLVLDWVGRTPTPLAFISVVTIAELQRGALAKVRKDAVQGRMLLDWVAKVMSHFDRRCLPVDARIALICAGLHVPNPQPDDDAWIAATALAHDLIVVTRNERDFAAMGVKLLNPWARSTYTSGP